MSNSSDESSPCRWVSIRRPASAMTSRSGGIAGGGWEYPESPPTPPRRRWHTFQPETWGRLRGESLGPLSPESVVQAKPPPLPCNPPPASLVSTVVPKPEENSSANRCIEASGAGGDAAADEESPVELVDDGVGLTQAWLHANLEVKIQMKKMGIYVSDSEADE